MLGNKKYKCGCIQNQTGINLCVFHLVLFDITINELKNELSNQRYIDISKSLAEYEEEQNLLQQNDKPEICV